MFDGLNITDFINNLVCFKNFASVYSKKETAGQGVQADLHTLNQQFYEPVFWLSTAPPPLNLYPLVDVVTRLVHNIQGLF